MTNLELEKTEKKIAIVTGGGDCPGLNTVIRAIVKAAALRGWGALAISSLMKLKSARVRNHAVPSWAIYNAAVSLHSGTANCVRALACMPWR